MFVQMNARLVEIDDQWREVSRWIKYQENVEDGGKRWSKPFVPSWWENTSRNMFFLVMASLLKYNVLSFMMKCFFNVFKIRNSFPKYHIQTFLSSFAVYSELKELIESGSVIFNAEGSCVNSILGRKENSSMNLQMPNVVFTSLRWCTQFRGADLPWQQWERADQRTVWARSQTQDENEFRPSTVKDIR